MGLQIFLYQGLTGLRKQLLRKTRHVKFPDQCAYGDIVISL